MSADLKACPFCGSTRIFLQRPVRDSQLVWQTRCSHCGAEICHPDRDRVIAYWNTRYETVVDLLRKR